MPPLTPSSPSPEHAARNLSVTLSFAWTGGDPDPGDLVSYQLLLGTTPELLETQTTLHGLTFWQPDLLAFDTTYFWQIIAADGHSSETAGPVWQFSTFSKNGDEDTDGLINSLEIDLDTDPFDNDSDRDGYYDGDEFNQGFDPNDSTVRPPCPPEYGDFDGDLTIDANDLALFRSILGLTSEDPGFITAADLNMDGKIDAADIELFSRVFGYAITPACGL